MANNRRAPLASAVIAFAIMAAMPGAGAAQIGFAVAGGPTVPIGTLGDAVETGYNAQLSATVSLPLFPIGIRVDGMLNQFPGEGEAGDFHVLSGTVNGILSMPSVGITPYLIGGVGFYNGRPENVDSSTDIGANVGAGVRVGLPGLSVFGEARLHNVFASEGEDLRFIPISLGIRL